jgi:hypothetical protein
MTVEKSPLHSSSREKAKEKRTLVIRPVGVEKLRESECLFGCDD